MATDKKEKKEALGTKINLSSIVKKAEQKREAAIVNYPPPPELENKKKLNITVSKPLLNEFRDLYYSLIRELGSSYVYLSRGEVFTMLISFMDNSLNIDISEYKDLYDKYIGTKGRRYTNDRTILKEEEKVKNYCWAELNQQQMITFRNLLTKLAVKIGVEKRSDFSKQYFMVDIIDFFRENVVELSEYIKSVKNGR